MEPDLLSEGQDSIIGLTSTSISPPPTAQRAVAIRSPANRLPSRYGSVP
ncbi:unknown [Candidatus Colimorpha enterica]|uniref:Uncharacterized protein n=1 Tax=Candidatus Colimorpha enterica TaxID=3083063 RepID=R6TRS9_9BACT|nr:unknown [Candidatus Colimorpha enterica]